MENTSQTAPGALISPARRIGPTLSGSTPRIRITPAGLGSTRNNPSRALRLRTASGSSGSMLPDV
jgi:hypothetical protein